MQVVFKNSTGDAQIHYYNWLCNGVIGTEPAQELCFYDEVSGEQLCRPLGDGVMQLELGS